MKKNEAEFVKASNKLFVEAEKTEEAKEQRRQEIAKYFKEAEEESVEITKEDIKNGKPIDISDIVGSLDSGKPIEFYMHSIPGSTVWAVVGEELRKKGYSYEEICSALKSKAVRRAFDMSKGIDKAMLKLGQEIAKGL